MIDNQWVFMDAGDTFIYGYPTLYEALQDCWADCGETISINALEDEVRRFMKHRPPLNLDTQQRFTQYFETLYLTIFEQLNYPSNSDQAVTYLWDEWRQAHRLRLFDDARGALERLREAGYRLGVISNWDETFLSTLKRLNVDHLFDVKVGSVDLGISKPDRRIFEYALQQAGVPALRTDETGPLWYLGDQVEMDIQPAQTLGMKTILVDYYRKRMDQTAADYYAPSLSVAVNYIL